MKAARLLPFAWALIWSVGVAPVTAQLYGQPKGAPKPDAKIDGEVVLAGATPTPQGLILSIGYADKPVTALVDPKCKIEITGTAEPDFVQAANGALMVRFKAEVNNRTKTAVNPVTEIEIITVGELNKPGVIADGLGGAFVEPEPGKAKTNSPTGNYQITGPVTGYKNGVMMVQGVKVPVDPAAKVSVTLNSPQAIALLPNRSILTVKGDLYSQLGRGLLKSIEAKLPEPLTVPNKNPRAAPPSKAMEKKADAPAKEE